MKYDLKDIITFAHVARLKSFIRAAQLLEISKTVVSTRITELEKSLGINLLSRTTREVNLTSEGKDFFEYCNLVLQKVENLDDFLQKSLGISGRLKLVLPPYFSRCHIVPHLDEFLKEYPKLKLDIFLTENPVNIISEGYDLQVRIQTPNDENLEVAKLMSNHKIICAAPSYLERHGTPKSPRDLLNHNCLIFGENEIWDFKHKTSGEEIILHDMDGNIKCNNGEIVKELVLAGIGITLKSSRDVENEIKEKKLIVLFGEYEILHETEFYAVYPAGKYMSPKIKAFIKFFQNKLNKIGGVKKIRESRKMKDKKSGKLLVENQSKNLNKKLQKKRDKDF